ncbi:MAG: HAMP domain-containing sensor histidine kinase [Eubacteriaceae bacterium]|nr:HAMP domain-containing sensor histidine kinase [Eubacteriaceae bacterium]MDD4507696.1 HAMP domain-containing sensor histidine kinase [Eubacteriaceae bacterium]
MFFNKKQKKPKHPMKLYTRIVVFFTTAFFIVLFVSFVMVFLFSQQIIQNENKQNLIKFNNYVINVIEENQNDILSLPEQQRLQFIADKIYPNVKNNDLISYKISDNNNQSYLSVDSINYILAPENFSSKRNLFKINITNSSRNTNGSNEVVDTIKYGENSFNYIGSSYTLNNQYTIYIQSVKNLKDSYTFMHILYFIQIVICLFAFGIVIIIGIYGTKQTLKPLINIADTAKEITDKNLNIRIQETGNNDEIDDLIQSLNQMISQLEKAFDIQKQFVSDASHELRIPLTIMQGYLDILVHWGSNDSNMRQEAIDSISNEVDNMKTMVNSLLMLTRLENRYYSETLEPINLSIIINKCFEECRIIDTHHCYKKRIEPNCIILGNRGLVLQALRGVLDNSIKYTPTNKEIALICFKEQSMIQLKISDKGIGISRDELEKVTHRFYRVSDDRSKETGGNGLGLSIVESIVSLHQGTLKIESQLNKGTTVCLIFPVYHSLSLPSK